ncbi:MAG: hypothetical protein SOU16_01790 [Faecalimonas sp.]|nr:hypothetical protein [Faecalimonas sp.]
MKIYNITVNNMMCFCRMIFSRAFLYGQVFRHTLLCACKEHLD